jgi:hypothetical protein
VRSNSVVDHILLIGFHLKCARLNRWVALPSERELIAHRCVLIPPTAFPHLHKRSLHEHDQIEQPDHQKRNRMVWYLSERIKP